MKCIKGYKDCYWIHLNEVCEKCVDGSEYRDSNVKDGGK
jgi:hypothetical protein